MPHLALGLTKQPTLYLLRFVLTGLLIFSEGGCQGVDSESLNVDQNPPPPPFCGSIPPPQVRCARPWLPYLDQVPLGGSLELIPPQGSTLQVALTSEIERQEPRDWSAEPHLHFTSLGRMKVFVKVSGEEEPCSTESFSHIYEVVDTFTPEANHSDSEALSWDDPRFIAWAEAIEDVEFGEEVSPLFRDVNHALGPAQGEAFDVVSLGRGGQITLSFPEGIANGSGPDFAVFENAFNDFFLELAWVEVSSDGEHFTRFPHAYLGEDLIGTFTESDPTWISGLAGKYRLGYGAPFDLSDLAWSPDTQSGLLDLHAIHFVRIKDIIGDGSALDSFQRPIYDPYPTQSSAGFDLDAVGVIHTRETAPCPSDDEGE